MVCSNEAKNKDKLFIYELSLLCALDYNENLILMMNYISRLNLIGTLY